MATPTPTSAAHGRSNPTDSWHLLVQCLTVANPGQASSVADALNRLRDAGCRPFEAIVGAPFVDYGPRVTVEPALDAVSVAAELGFSGHPWGPPSWYGLRFGPDGAEVLKPYHRMSSVPAEIQPPVGLPAGLAVDLAARHADRTEVYFRRVVPGRWGDFAVAMTRLVGRPAPLTTPVPRDVVGAHCASVSWTGDRLTAVTLYAQDRALPADREITRAWSGALTGVDLAAYQAALGGVRSESKPGIRSLHGLLAWTCSVDGSSSRAVSLRLGRMPWF